jgi:hypothetical protein
VADELSLSRLADLGDVEITMPAASAIAAFFGNLDEAENTELEALPLPAPLPEPDPEPEPEPPSGQMAEFDEAAVLAWLGTVLGLTAAQRAATAAERAEDEHNGCDLFHATAKTLRRLLKGTAAEEAVPALLAARDSCLAAEAAEVAAAVAEEAAAAAEAAVVVTAAAVAAAKESAAKESAAAAAAEEVAAAEPAAAPGCQICFETYGSVRPSLKFETSTKLGVISSARSSSLSFESHDPPAAGTL